MKPFEGTWKCEVTFPAGDDGADRGQGQGDRQVQEGHGRLLLEGRLRGRQAEGRSPAGRSVLGRLGAPALSEITFTSVDSMGGSTLESGKPEADSVTTTGEGYMMGHKVKIRETLWHKDKTGGHNAEMDMGKGWMSMGKDECRSSRRRRPRHQA